MPDVTDRPDQSPMTNRDFPRELREGADWLVMMGVGSHVAECARSAADEIEDLRSDVIAFCAPWAAQWARENGLPDRHLHPTHYDILARVGARMDDFIRGDAP